MMAVLLNQKYEIFPTEEQKEMLDRGKGVKEEAFTTSVLSSMCSQSYRYKFFILSLNSFNHSNSLL